MSADTNSTLRGSDFVAGALLLAAGGLYGLVVRQGDQCFNHLNCRPGEAVVYFVLALVSGLAGVGTLGFSGRTLAAQVVMGAWTFMAVVPPLLLCLNDFIKRLA